MLAVHSQGKHLMKRKSWPPLTDSPPSVPSAEENRPLFPTPPLRTQTDSRTVEGQEWDATLKLSELMRYMRKQETLELRHFGEVIPSLSVCFFQVKEDW